jgi:hypothetical protein
VPELDVEPPLDATPELLVELDPAVPLEVPDEAPPDPVEVPLELAPELPLELLDELAEVPPVPLELADEADVDVVVELPPAPPVDDPSPPDPRTVPPSERGCNGGPVPRSASFDAHPRAPTPSRFEAMATASAALRVLICMAPP